MPNETTENPFIERPDEHVVGNELYCWIPGSGDRECNGSCVAFAPESLQNDQMDTCKALNALRSIALSLGIQAKAAKTRQTSQEVAARKGVVDQLPAPPEVKI